MAQNVHKRQTVFSSGEGDHHPISILDHTELSHRAADEVQDRAGDLDQLGLLLLNWLGFFLIPIVREGKLLFFLLVFHILRIIII